MSYKATNWAWELGLKMPEKFVLVALADMADEKQSCYPGQATLSRMTGASERTVRRAITSLEDAGLLTREERRTEGGYRTSDRYVLQVGATLDSNRSDWPVVDLTGHTDQPHRSHRPTSPVTVTGTYKEEPLENHQGESSDTRVALIASVSFDDFWGVWPRKVAKPDARRAWDKAVKTVPGEVILAGAIAYRDNPGRPEKQFIPHPATWLNRSGWDDELPEARGGRVGAVDAGREADAMLAARERQAVGA
ncbi:helix-turn-helix domain-containing protein [Microbacterium sp. NPDC090007]|uniref:helix-turn-helix domain-containing protein n=1 Tax=Microbacterium sp. NPDC090007 TaxID=3364204 RepID=UPI003800FD52